MTLGRILFVTRQDPFPGASGSGVYAWGILRHLAQSGWQVHVAWTEAPDTAHAGGRFALDPDCDALVSLNIRGMRHCSDGSFTNKPPLWREWQFKARIAGGSLKRSLGFRRRAQAAEQESHSSEWCALASKEEAAFCSQQIESCKPSLVLMNYVWMVPALDRSLFPELPMAVLAHDARHRHLELGEHGAIEVLGRHWERDHERELLAQADLVVAIQRREEHVFQQMLKTDAVVTALPVFPIRPQPFQHRQVLLFVGSHHASNHRGLRWFLDHAWPVIRARCPVAELLVVGTVCELLRGDLAKGVTLRGPVDDLSAVYAEAALVIAPVLEGSGFKIKLLEAAAHGRTCVTTSVGIEGAEDLCPPFQIADTPAQFADCIAEALDDLMDLEKLGQQAAYRAEECFTAPECYAALDKGLVGCLQARAPAEEAKFTDFRTETPCIR